MMPSELLVDIAAKMSAGPHREKNVLMQSEAGASAAVK